MHLAPRNILAIGPLVASMGRFSPFHVPGAIGATAVTSGGWTATRRIVYVPIVLPLGCTALKAWWVNGATASGNVEVGIYDAAANLPTTLLVTTGSVAQSGTSVIQSADITDTVLAPAHLYFLAMSMDNTTGTVGRKANALYLLQTTGMVQETPGVFGLPATATPVTVSANFLPLFGFSTITTI